MTPDAPIQPKEIEELVREREALKEEKQRLREERKLAKERGVRNLFLEKLVAPFLFFATVVVSFLLYFFNNQ